MQFLLAQKDMRMSYASGAAGLFFSGIIWITAAFVASLVSIDKGVLTLFIGGMFIHPLSILLVKLFKCTGKHDKDNPLGQLAIESIFLLFIGIFIAFITFNIQSYLFFPIMLMVIGGRYLIFSTLYGLRVYWLIGGSLVILGGIVSYSIIPSIFGALIGGIIEIIFAYYVGYLFRSERHSLQAMS